MDDVNIFDELKLKNKKRFYLKKKQNKIEKFRGKI